MHKRSESKPTDTVSHNQVIDSHYWWHQVTQVIFHPSHAGSFIKAYQLEEKVFNELQCGQIIICTLYGNLIGIAKDSEEIFRLITFP